MGLSRRKFLIGTGLVGGGLILGVTLGRSKPPYPNALPDSFQPNAWLQISTDGRFIFQLHKAEMGQGVIASLPVLLAEELDIDPARFEIAMAGVHPDYADSSIGVQITGGSSSVSGSWDNLRHAGAAARAMLIAAAAQRWSVTTDQCSTDNGTIINTLNNDRLTYADLAAEASEFSDAPYQLKSAADYRWIGQNLPRPDSVSKSTGTARFGVDVQLPDMKTAVIVRCPHFGGSLNNWSADSVTKSEGVVTAFAVHSGIAIVADSYWQARKAANQLQVEWHKGPLAGLDSNAIRAGQRQALQTTEPYIVFEQGEQANAVSDTEHSISAEYYVPHTHHSPMEPQNATALYTTSAEGNRCEVWAPNQAPDICRALIAHYAEVSHDNAIINSTLLGGGFGRRGYPDYVAEAAAVARQLPGTPIKLMWSREDDMQHDFYRPSSLHQLQASLSAQGTLGHWQHRLATPSILSGFGVYIMSTVLPDWVPTAVARAMGRGLGNTLADYDPSKAEGAKIAYSADTISVGQVNHDPGIPIGFWRSVSFSFNVFAVESFMDELAHKANADPLAFRLQHLPQAPRYQAVLQLAAEKAGWGQAPAGISQGIAVAEPFGTPCAMVAEVSVEGNTFNVKRVVAAIDCGLAVNPDLIKAQMESGIVYGLGAALKAPVTFVDGRTAQSNFHDLPVLRMNEIPKMEVYILPSDQPPTGVGEIGVPAIAPAIANALFAATGQRLRELPLQLAE